MAKKKTFNQRDSDHGRFESKAEAEAEPSTTQRERRRPLSDSGKLYNKLTRAIKGLTVMSESPTDSPFRIFKGVEPERGGLTPQEMLAQISRSADTPIEERDFDQFFENLVGSNDTERREKVLRLKSFLQANLTDIHVFVVPSKSKATTKKLYVVGIDAEGNVSGLRVGNLTES